MSIYVDALKVSEKESYVGVILTGDQDQTYFRWTGLLHSEQKAASLMGVQRAFSFKQANNPLYCNREQKVFNNFVNKDMLMEDEYCSRFKIQSVADFKSAEEEIDKRYISEVQSLTQVYYRQYYLIDLYNKMHNEGKV